jgi:hypothetical protein
MFLRKETPSLQLYGKLTLAKDYLRIRCAEGEAKHLRAWLDESFSTSADEGGQPEPAGPMRFVLDGKVPVQGSFWPSSDAGGLRRFPIVFLVERKRRPFLEDFGVGWAKAAAAWTSLEALYAGHSRFEDGQSFLAAMRREELAFKDLVPEDVAVDAVAWSRALWPEEGARALIPLFDRLRQLRSEGGREPIRLPLVANLSPAVQVNGWWQILVEAGLLSSDELPRVFFTQLRNDADEPAFATFFRAPLRTTDTAWIGRVSDEPLGATDLALANAGSAELDASAAERPLADGLLHIWKKQ